MMPVSLSNIGGGRMRVSTPGGIKAKATTPEKAKAQGRLLNGIDNGWKPTLGNLMRRGKK